MSTVRDNTENQNGMLRLNIYPANLNSSGEILCYYPNSSITSDFNHFAMQMVADERIPKGALRVNLCSDDKGEVPVYSLDVPTLDFKFFRENKDYRGVGVAQVVYDKSNHTNNDAIEDDKTSLIEYIGTQSGGQSATDVVNAFAKTLGGSNATALANNFDEDGKLKPNVTNITYPIAVIDNFLYNMGKHSTRLLFFHAFYCYFIFFQILYFLLNMHYCILLFISCKVMFKLK